MLSRCLVFAATPHLPKLRPTFPAGERILDDFLHGGTFRHCPTAPAAAAGWDQDPQIHIMETGKATQKVLHRSWSKTFCTSTIGKKSSSVKDMAVMLSTDLVSTTWQTWPLWPMWRHRCPPGDIFSLKTIAVHFSRPDDRSVFWRVSWWVLCGSWLLCWICQMICRRQSGCKGFTLGSRWLSWPQEQHVFYISCSVYLTTPYHSSCLMVSFFNPSLDDDPWWRCIVRWVENRNYQTSCVVFGPARRSEEKDVQPKVL